MVWAIEALEVGYLVRRRSSPEITSRAVKARTVVQAAMLALVKQFTEEVPLRDAASAARRRLKT